MGIRGSHTPEKKEDVEVGSAIMMKPEMRGNGFLREREFLFVKNKRMGKINELERRDEKQREKEENQKPKEQGPVRTMKEGSWKKGRRREEEEEMSRGIKHEKGKEKSQHEDKASWKGGEAN